MMKGEKIRDYMSKLVTIDVHQELYTNMVYGGEFGDISRRTEYIIINWPIMYYFTEWSLLGLSPGTAPATESSGSDPPQAISVLLWLSGLEHCHAGIGKAYFNNQDYSLLTGTYSAPELRYNPQHSGSHPRQQAGLHLHM